MSSNEFFQRLGFPKRLLPTKRLKSTLISGSSLGVENENIQESNDSIMTPKFKKLSEQKLWTRPNSRISTTNGSEMTHIFTYDKDNENHMNRSSSDPIDGEQVENDEKDLGVELRSNNSKSEYSKTLKRDSPTNESDGILRKKKPEEGEVHSLREKKMLKRDIQPFSHEGSNIIEEESSLNRTDENLELTSKDNSTQDIIASISEEKEQSIELIEIALRSAEMDWNQIFHDIVRTPILELVSQHSENLDTTLENSLGTVNECISLEHKFQIILQNLGYT